MTRGKTLLLTGMWANHAVAAAKSTLRSLKVVARELELLAVTLQLLQQNGYDRLTMGAVATTARASKATMYRRWSSKAELVTTAFIESMRQAAVPPDTGTLRGDLLQIGPLVCQQASTIRAVLVEASRNSGLNDVLQHEFLGRWKAVMQCILKQAVDRGEIENDAIDVDPWDVLPGYLVFRSIIPHGSPTRNTVQALVHNVIIPSLTRPTA
jgi:AcrR family transcriptional regulator